MEKCVVFADDMEYESIINQLLYEMNKGNMELCAIVCNEGDKYCSSRDGFPLIYLNEVDSSGFDWFIIADEQKYAQIKRNAMKQGVSEKKIINGKVFKLPLFDFRRYIQLLRCPVTILSDDCWGGMYIIDWGLNFLRH